MDPRRAPALAGGIHAGLRRRSTRALHADVLLARRLAGVRSSTAPRSTWSTPASPLALPGPEMTCGFSPCAALGLQTVRHAGGLAFAARGGCVRARLPGAPPRSAGARQSLAPVKSPGPRLVGCARSSPFRSASGSRADLPRRCMLRRTHDVRRTARVGRRRACIHDRVGPAGAARSGLRRETAITAAIDSRDWGPLQGFRDDGDFVARPLGRVRPAPAAAGAPPGGTRPGRLRYPS